MRKFNVGEVSGGADTRSETWSVDVCDASDSEPPSIMIEQQQQQPPSSQQQQQQQHQQRMMINHDVTQQQQPQQQQQQSLQQQHGVHHIRLVMSDFVLSSASISPSRVI